MYHYLPACAVYELTHHWLSGFIKKAAPAPSSGSNIIISKISTYPPKSVSYAIAKGNGPKAELRPEKKDSVQQLRQLPSRNRNLFLWECEN